MRFYRALILRAWWVVLLVLFGAGVWLGRYALDLDVDTSTSVLLNEDDSDLAYYVSTRPFWGYDQYATFCVTRDDWITPEGVALLRELVDDLEAVPYVRAVTSILDVPLLRQTSGPLIGPSGFVRLGDEGVDLDRAREEILDHTLVRGNLISETGRDLGILAHVDIPEEMQRIDPVWSRLQGERLTSAEARREIERLRPAREAASAELRRRQEAMVAGIRRLAARWGERLPEPVRLSGTPVLGQNILEHLHHDLRVFGLACLALFVVGFLAIYRRIRFVVLPILTCLLTVTIIVGTMSWLEMKVTVTTANLPLLLFVLMLPYTVYFIERYREQRARYPEEDGATSIFEAARVVFVPCFFSCTTTVAGFAALTTSHTHPIRSFGLMMAIGMVVGLVTVFLTIPSLSRPLPAAHIDPEECRRPARGVVRLFERLALGGPGAVVLVGSLLFLVAFVGALRVSAQSKFTEYFWPHSEVYRGLEYIDTRLGGTASIEIILESDEEGFFLRAEGLDALRAAARYFDEVPETGNVRSLATLVDELKKKAPGVTAMLPFLVRVPEVGDLVREYATEDHRVSRIVVRMRETARTLDRNRVLRGLREHLETDPALAGIQTRETGVFLLYANMLNSLVRSQRDTFLLVIGAVYLMLVLLFRSPVLGLLVLLPQSLPAVVVLGVMGWCSIPLDLVTVMTAVIAVGVGIDAAIQYTVRYRSELAVDGDRRAALRRSHGRIGRAIWIATTVIIVGFSVLLLSDFRPSVWFGLFTAVAMLMSQITALTILPSIFLLTGYPKR